MEMLAAAVHPGPQGRGQAAEEGGAKVSVPLPSSPRMVLRTERYKRLGNHKNPQRLPVPCQPRLAMFRGYRIGFYLLLGGNPVCMHMHAFI